MSRQEFREKSIRQWQEMLGYLFHCDIPQQLDWCHFDQIVKVLNLIGTSDVTNHMFFPSGGGHDLLGSSESHESGCIELNFNPSGRSASVVKPKQLTFNSFDSAVDWSYFRLDLENLEPSGVYENLASDMEELTELSPGQYVERTWWDAGFYGHDESGAEISLPESARLIVRHLSGSFVIFAKGSIYNTNPDTYDARHAKMSANAFRKYISNIAAQIP